MSRRRHRSKRERQRAIEKANRAAMRHVKVIPHKEPATYADYLCSAHWHLIRRVCKARDGYACLLCGTTHNLEVHHLVYRDLWIHTVPSDCATLCTRCHDAAHAASVPLRLPFPAPRVWAALSTNHHLVERLAHAVNLLPAP